MLYKVCKTNHPKIAWQSPKVRFMLISQGEDVEIRGERHERVYSALAGDLKRTTQNSTILNRLVLL